MAAVSSPNDQAGLVWRSTRSRVTIARASRYLGALAVLATGVAHIEQYAVDDYSSVPTIGTLFLLSFIGAGIVGTTLLMPVRRFGERIGDLILSLAALGAIGIALGTLVSLLYSEYRPLFGFMESGYRLAVELTLLFDGLTTVFLGLFLALVGPQLIHSFRSNHLRAAQP